ncbi:MAG TPA: serine/threonine-protein kinase [Gemmatimonadaceae bacterium]|nr:serine/threonine-protein kinase [Gemmatimonadaceae bacterium]
MASDDHLGPAKRTTDLPSHLASWQLPPGWAWGSGGLIVSHRHVQEVRDALDRSLALVTAPDTADEAWLFAEAKHLAHRNHPAIPTTYHYWTGQAGNRRGPGYLRRWLAGETVGTRVRRMGTDTVPYMLRVLRAAGSALAYLHDSAQAHGAVSPDTIYVTPTGRVWLLGWSWAVPSDVLPAGAVPDAVWTPSPAEWAPGQWAPTPESDQWQLAATCFAILTGELPPRTQIPPLRWVRPDCPTNVAELIDRALAEHPADRFHSVASLLRAVEKISSSGSSAITGLEVASGEYQSMNEEQRLRWATGDDYEVLSALGSGTFGSVWRVRDLTLQREVALKMLHPTVARSEDAVARFQKEARLAARLQHPAIVPIYSWDQKGGVHWYVMELEDEGSIGDLVRRQGPRPIAEVGPQIAFVLDGLAAAHQHGIIHRDLKPENVLLSRYRHWRIADFGIAAAMGEDRPGTSGTPAFAPPEQLLGEPQGVAADLFALAAIAYFALTGRAPFDGSDARAILAQQLAGKVDLDPIPDELHDWFRRALSADPDERFTDATTMRDAWNAAVEPLVLQATNRPLAERLRRAAEQLFR